MHSSGKHEKHEHSHGDSEGIAEHIHKNLGGGAMSGQSDEGEAEQGHEFGL
jgi:hypothetical protein